MSIYAESIGLEEYKAAEPSRVGFPHADEIHNLFMINDREEPEALRAYAKVDYIRSRLTELAINVTLLDRDLQPGHSAPIISRLENGFWLPDMTVKFNGEKYYCEARTGFFSPYGSDTHEEIEFIASRVSKDSIPPEYH